MALISRYLIREISRPFLFILGALVAVFASYCAAGILASAVNSLLPTNTIAEIVALKVLIALDVLIPIALFASVVLGFGRLYGDSEITAMAALSVSPATMVGAVLTVSGYLAIGVAALSLVARPWAYRQLHNLSQASAAILNVGAMQAGTFYIGQNGHRVIYLGRRDTPGAPAQNVFIRLQYADHTEIIHAAQAEPLPAAAGGNPKVVLQDAHVYELGYAQPASDRIVNAQTLLVDPDNRGGASNRYATAATSSSRLAMSHSATDVAELQWRLSTPVSTLLLGLFGLPLSRVRPRQSRYARFGTALLVYCGYYLVCMSARSWVQQGLVPGFPGLWWAPALLGLALLAAWYRPPAWRHGA